MLHQAWVSSRGYQSIGPCPSLTPQFSAGFSDTKSGEKGPVQNHPLLRHGKLKCEVTKTVITLTAPLFSLQPISQPIGLFLPPPQGLHTPAWKARLPEAFICEWKNMCETACGSIFSITRKMNKYTGYIGLRDNWAAVKMNDLYASAWTGLKNIVSRERGKLQSNSCEMIACV